MTNDARQLPADVTLFVTSRHGSAAWNFHRQRLAVDTAALQAYEYLQSVSIISYAES